jgi:hypothetical protein
MACERITAGSRPGSWTEKPDPAMVDPYNPTGSSATSTSPPAGRTAGRRPGQVPRQLGGAGQRLGGRVLPRRRGSTRPSMRLREEPQPRLRGALPLRLRDAHLPARLHRPGGRRPRARPAPPRRRDQGLPRRGRQGQEVHHGDLLGARREPPRQPRPLGLRRVHGGLPDRADFEAKVEQAFEPDGRGSGGCLAATCDRRLIRPDGGEVPERMTADGFLMKGSLVGRTTTSTSPARSWPVRVCASPGNSKPWRRRARGRP